MNDYKMSVYCDTVDMNVFILIFIHIAVKRSYWICPHNKKLTELYSKGLKFDIVSQTSLTNFMYRLYS